MRDDDLIKYPRTQHIEGSRLQQGDHDLEAVPLTELAGRHVVIEEKIDGANCGISFARRVQAPPPQEWALRLQSRGHFLTGGAREKHFALLKTWAGCHQRRLHELIGERYVLYGEWVYAKHTIYYDDLPHYLLEFDLLDRETGAFLDTARRDALLDRALVPGVPVLYRGPAPERLEQLVELVGPSLYKRAGWRERLAQKAAERGLDPARVLTETDPSDLAEGLYIKVEEGGEVVARYKWVRASFLSVVVDSGSHWLARPIVENGLAEGVDIYADPAGSSSADGDAEAGEGAP